MSDSAPVTTPRRRWRPVISLRDIFLVLCVLGVLLAWRRDHVELSNDALYATYAGARSKPGGWALAFDGSGTRVTAPHIPFDEYETFTIEAWVRGWRGVVLAQGAAGDPENSVWLAVGTRDDSPYETCGWEAEKGTNHQVAIGKKADRIGWNHVALVYDGERQNVFVNGKLVRSRRVPPPSPLVRKRLLQIGVHDDTHPKHGSGLLGPMRISKSVRYPEPFEPNWEFTVDSDTVLLYALAEGGGTRLQDSSGNGNEAIVRGPRWFSTQDVFSLDFRQTQVTDTGLKRLKTLKKLEILSLERTAITDVGLEHLKGLRSLKYLDIRDTAATGVGVKQIRKSLPNCKIVGSPANPTALK